MSLQCFIVFSQLYFITFTTFSFSFLFFCFTFFTLCLALSFLVRHVVVYEGIPLTKELDTVSANGIVGCYWPRWRPPWDLDSDDLLLEITSVQWQLFILLYEVTLLLIKWPILARYFRFWKKSLARKTISNTLTTVLLSDPIPYCPYWLCNIMFS